MTDFAIGMIGGSVLAGVALYIDLKYRLNKVGIKDIGKKKSTKEWVIYWKDESKNTWKA